MLPGYFTVKEVYICYVEHDTQKQFLFLSILLQLPLHRLVELQPSDSGLPFPRLEAKAKKLRLWREEV